ncbi:MAG TPA: hypothetical protein VM388_06140 [Acidimicrobiales bacterium]|nr:hypothetical protein [Acidimicrobiales bacterium]
MAIAASTSSSAAPPSRPDAGQDAGHQHDGQRAGGGGEGGEAGGRCRLHQGPAQEHAEYQPAGSAGHRRDRRPAGGQAHAGRQRDEDPGVDVLAGVRRPPLPAATVERLPGTSTVTPSRARTCVLAVP